MINENDIHRNTIYQNFMIQWVAVYFSSHSEKRPIAKQQLFFRKFPVSRTTRIFFNALSCIIQSCSSILM